MDQSAENAPAVVITGASSGIGRTTALDLDRRGFRVFAGYRRDADASSLAAESSGGVTPVRIDVTQQASIEAARDEIAEALEGQPLLGLVNNAAISVAWPLEFVDVDALRGQFEINTFGVAAVTSAMLPLISRPGGRIVNVSSGAGRIVTPLIGPYCASKYALVALSDALRVELRGQGLHVSVVEPGFIDTPIHEKNDRQIEDMLASLPSEGRDRYGPAIAKLRATSESMSKGAAQPEAVSKAIHRALVARRPRSRYPVTAEARLLQVLGPFLGNRIRDAIFGRIVGL
jgi:NAD(P)-dependent dehydrogenase (short-subunit alcohol dehydrogenase family)